MTATFPALLDTDMLSEVMRDRDSRVRAAAQRYLAEHGARPIARAESSEWGLRNGCGTVPMRNAEWRMRNHCNADCGVVNAEWRM